MTKEEAVNRFISRADVLGYIDRLETSGLGKGKALEYFRKYVKKADSVSAERVGEWIAKTHKGEYVEFDVYVCSECGIVGGISANEWNYCPNCGAKMKGGTNG